MQKAQIFLLLCLSARALGGCGNDDDGSSTPTGGAGAAGSAQAGTGGTEQGAGAAGAAGGEAGAAGAGTAGAAGAGTAGTTGGVSYATDAQPIYAKHCSPCHTTEKDGGVNFATSYTDSQMDSHHCDGITTGACTIVRIKDGSMPQGKSCTGDPTKDAANAACLTAAEQATLEAWIAGGELP